MRLSTCHGLNLKCLPGPPPLEFCSPDGGIILGGCGTFRNWGQARKVVAGEGSAIKGLHPCPAFNVSIYLLPNPMKANVSLTGR